MSEHEDVIYVSATEDWMNEAKQVRAKRRVDMGSKYGDTDIRVLINNAKLSCEHGARADALASATVAQAMLAYNAMIDKRWE
jgi:hypothetical protein